MANKFYTEMNSELDGLIDLNDEEYKKKMQNMGQDSMNYMPQPGGSEGGFDTNKAAKLAETFSSDKGDGGGTVGGAAQGAMAGASLGPYGAVIGGAVGALKGTLQASENRKQRRREADAMYNKNVANIESETSARRSQILSALGSNLGATLRR